MTSALIISSPRRALWPQGWTATISVVCNSRSNLGARSSSIGAGSSLNAGMLVAQAVIVLLPWWPPLFNLSLGPSDCSVYLVANLFYCWTPIEFLLHNLVGLKEALELRWKFVVLACDQAHVLVKSINFGLSIVRTVNLDLVLLFQSSQVILKRLQFTRACLEPDLCISFTDLQFFGATDLILVGFYELWLSLLVPPILLFVIANLVVKLF